MTSHDVSLGDTTRYLLAVLWSVLVPGVLIHRALRGRSRDLITELTFGFVIGLATQLAAWAAFVCLGAGRLLIGYPALVVGVFFAVRRLRPHLRLTRYPHTTPAPAAWALTAAYAVTLLGLAATLFVTSPLPPGRARWYQDLYWHLSITAQAKQHAPPLVPQLGDATLKYHWFANAHMAATSWVSGIDPIAVTARLWYLPTYAVIIVATFALTRHLSRSATAGVLAVVLLSTGAALLPLSGFGPYLTSAYLAVSPSQMMAIAPMLAACWLIIDRLRRPPRPADTGALVLILVLCAGSKSSVLPTLAAGTALATLVGARHPAVRRQGLVTTSLIILVGAICAPVLAGGSSGSTLGWLTTQQRDPAYRAVLAADGPTTWMLYLLLVALVVQFAYLVLALGVRSRGRRPEPAVWFAIGTFCSALLAVLVINHTGQSQGYFVLGALPLWVVVSAWGTASLVHRARAYWPRRTVALCLIGAGVIGAATTLAIRAAGSSHPPTTTAALTRSTTTLGVLIVAILATAGLGAALRHHRPALAALILASGAAALSTASVVPAALQQPPLKDGLGQTSMANALTPAQISGTTWLRRHTPPTDLIATNVRCQPNPSQSATRRCDARAYWVTGLGERAAYLEGWAYTDRAQAQAAANPDGPPVMFLPFWDPARQLRNDVVFTSPTPANLSTVYDAGVRWLFADTRAGPVHPRLADLTDIRFRAGTITIYQLRR